MPIPEEEFQRRLEEKIDHMSAHELLVLVPDAYSEVSEALNNEIIEEWEQSAEGIGEARFRLAQQVCQKLYGKLSDHVVEVIDEFLAGSGWDENDPLETTCREFKTYVDDNPDELEEDPLWTEAINDMEDLIGDQDALGDDTVDVDAGGDNHRAEEDDTRVFDEDLGF